MKFHDTATIIKNQTMPELSRFYGLEISFKFNDHLPPHIHVKHDGAISLVLIKTGDVLKGPLQGQGAKMIKEWVLLHQEELNYVWETKETITIEPLK